MEQNNQKSNILKDNQSSDALDSNNPLKTSSMAATVVISRFVTPGHEHQYQNWVQQVLEAVEKFPNYYGSVILAPGAGQSNLYHLVHRFADEISLHVWESSEILQKLVREADAFSTAERQAATGMETWFSLPGVPELTPPAKWKMAVTTFFAAYFLTLVLIPLEWITIPNLPFVVTNIVTNVLLVVLMTYCAMPVLSRLLRKWLYKGIKTR